MSLWPAELDACARRDQPRNHLIVALQDLHRVLEDHAPGWYTYEHHRRGELALRQEGHRQAEAFLTLYNLVEEYAPRWYTDELRAEARLAAQGLEKVAGRPHPGSPKPTAYP